MNNPVSGIVKGKPKRKSGKNLYGKNITANPQPKTMGNGSPDEQDRSTTKREIVGFSLVFVSLFYILELLYIGKKTDVIIVSGFLFATLGFGMIFVAPCLLVCGIPVGLMLMSSGKSARTKAKAVVLETP